MDFRDLSDLETLESSYQLFYAGKFTRGRLGTDNRLSLSDLQELKKLLSSAEYDSVIHSNGFGMLK